jgi:hypothetical protein
LRIPVSESVSAVALTSAATAACRRDSSHDLQAELAASAANSNSAPITIQIAVGIEVMKWLMPDAWPEAVGVTPPALCPGDRVTRSPFTAWRERAAGNNSEVPRASELVTSPLPPALAVFWPGLPASRASALAGAGTEPTNGFADPTSAGLVMWIDGPVLWTG